MNKNNKKISQADKFQAAYDRMCNMLPKEVLDTQNKSVHQAPTKKQQVKQAVKSGTAVVVTKQTGNKQGKQLNIAKLMDDEVEIKVKTVPQEIAIQVQQARVNAEKTQEELAKLVDCKLSTLKDLEKGEGEYDPDLVVKIEKKLGVHFERSWKKSGN